MPAPSAGQLWATVRSARLNIALAARRAIAALSSDR